MERMVLQKALSSFIDHATLDMKALKVLMIAHRVCLKLSEVEIIPEAASRIYWSNFGREFEKAWNAQA